LLTSSAPITCELLLLVVVQEVERGGMEERTDDGGLVDREKGEILAFVRDLWHVPKCFSPDLAAETHRIGCPARLVSPNISGDIFGRNSNVSLPLFSLLIKNALFFFWDRIN
jgi:hypothetical protein